LGIVPLAICIERDTGFQAEKKQGTLGTVGIGEGPPREAWGTLNDLSFSTSHRDLLYHRSRMGLAAILPALKTKRNQTSPR